MSHEDGMTPDEWEKERERFRSEPSAPPKVMTRAKGSITIDIPPVTLPTPAAIVRRLTASPIVWYSMMLLIGFAAGYAWHARPATVQPDPVITVTETLADFAARESTVLSAEERQKLIAVTTAVLGGHYETPADIREEFRFQRLKAGIHSPVYLTFSDRWATKVTEMNMVDSVESMRDIYKELLYGLQTVKSYIDLTIKESGDRSQESEDRNEETSVESVNHESIPPDSLLLSPDSSPTQRTRLFRRR